MKQKTGFSATAVVVIGLLLVTSTAQAAKVTIVGNTVTRIDDLVVYFDTGRNAVYDVVFRYESGRSVYGQNLDDFPFSGENVEEDAFTALRAINGAINAENPIPSSAGVSGQDTFFIGAEEDDGFVAAVGSEYFGSAGWGPCEPPNCIVGTAVLKADEQFVYADLNADGTNPPEDSVTLGGTVQEEGASTPLCAMVLASGQFTFSCNPNGPFSLTNLSRETDGSVKRQVYVDGFFPNVEVLQGSVDETVVMTRASNCPDYNSVPDPGFVPDSAGKWIKVSGKILLQNTQTPICAMALASGQFEFTCDGTGSYSGNIPLDANGQYKLQVYADGFAPVIQTFDEFSPNNDVRKARDAACP